MNCNLDGIVMTETMGVAIGIGVFALVFIYLGLLVANREETSALMITFTWCQYHVNKNTPEELHKKYIGS